MKYYYLIFSIFLLFSSCSENWGEKKTGTFNSFDEYRHTAKKETQSRTIAEDDAVPVCMKDRLQTKNLIQEIKRLEDARDGSLKNEYMSQYADLLDAGVREKLSTSAECIKSATCVLDSIYKEAYQVPSPADAGPTWSSSPVGDEAYLAYHWYLKTGSVINASKTTPGFADVNAPLGRYLFSSDELRILNEVVYRTPAAYRKLWPLRSIHKIPYPYKRVRSDGSISEGIADAQGGSFSIEISTTNGVQTRVIRNRPGSIRFYHDGLRLSRHEGHYQYDVSLRESAVHELSHELDFVIDNPKKDLVRVSNSKEWLELSGWRLMSAAGENGLVYTQWVSDPSKEGFVRWYAATDPSEDFADTAGFFRMEPSRLAQTPKKKELISGWFYDGRTFDENGILSFYQSFIESEMLGLIPSQLESCQGVQDASQISTPDRVYVSSANIALKLPEGLRKICLTSRFNQDLGEQLRRLRYYEWEACDFLSAAVIQKIAQTQAVAWASKMNAIDAGSTSAVAQSGILKKSVSDFSKNFDPREAYVSCYDDSDPEDCYVDQIEKMYASWLSAQPASLRGVLGDLKPLQLDHYKYQSARLRAIDSMNDMISGASDLVWNKTLELWSGCLTNRSEIVGVPKLDPYTGGDHFVRAGILDCLNRNIRTEMRAILVSYAKGKFQWTSEKALKFAVERVQKRVEWVLNMVVRDASDKEFKVWDEFYAKAVLVLVKPGSDCVNQAELDFAGWYGKQPVVTRPREDFFTKEEIFRHWAKRFCGV